METKTFATGQKLTFVQASGTRYEKPAKTVYSVSVYAYSQAEDEHLVIYPDGSSVAVLGKDLFA